MTTGEQEAERSVQDKKATPAALVASGMDCAECGMRCEPVDVFHPWLYCWLRQRGVLNPEAFLRQHGFMPDPDHWQPKASEVRESKQSAPEQIT